MQTAPEAFQDLVSELDYPMFVVTAASNGARAGCLVGFTTQCSIDPARFLVCLSKNNATWEVARTADALAVHFLRADQREIAEHFGSVSAKDDPDKLTAWPLGSGPGGLPILEDCDWFVGRVVGQVDLGDHTGFVLDPTDGELDHGPGPQLGYDQLDDIEAGQPAGIDH
ncbi:MAG: flavin reductase family protein [Acidimicrobiia bacterium]